MSESTDEYHFLPGETERFERSLRVFDGLLGDLVRTYRLRLRPHSGKGWPGRTLHGRRWLKSYEFRVSLNTSYKGPESTLRWDFHDIWMYDFAELWQQVRSFRTLAEAVAGEHLHSPSTRELIQRAIAENFTK